MTATILAINAKSSKLTAAYNNNTSGQSDRLVACLIHRSNNNRSHNNNNNTIINPSSHHLHRNSTKKLYPNNQKSISLGPTNLSYSNHPISLNRPNSPQSKKTSIPPSIEHWANPSQKVNHPTSADHSSSRHTTSSTLPSSPPPPFSSLPLSSSSSGPTATPPSSSSSRSSFPLSSHLPLSFPTAATPTPFAFNFPLPAPARHSPPPHPDPRPVISIQPPSAFQSHSPTDNRRLATYQRRTPQRAQPYPFWPSSPTFSSQLASSRRKRAPALPLVHSIRAKKIKLAHSHYRSHRLFYPMDCTPSERVAPSCTSQSSSLISPIMERPKWLHTSPAVEGHSSKLCPKEAQFTGTAQNWCVLPGSKPPTFSPSASGPCLRSPPPRFASSAGPPRPGRSMPPAGPPAAPLKAQLLAVLRMRSSLQPGEAALRLKKWVIWNSWVRGQSQRRLYPMANPTCVNTLPTPHRTSTLSDLSSDEWTGEEMFDDNGDLVCEVDALDGSEELEGNSYSNPRAIPKSDPINLEASETRKIQGITRSKVPPRINTSQHPSHLTPPSSPESQRIGHNDPNQLENHCCTLTVDVTDQLGQIRVSKKDQKPLTPPPSPPNQIEK